MFDTIWAAENMMLMSNEKSAAASAFQILAYINALLGIIGVFASFGNGQAKVLIYCIPAAFSSIAIASALNFLCRIANSLDNIKGQLSKSESNGQTRK